MCWCVCACVCVRVTERPWREGDEQDEPEVPVFQVKHLSSELFIVALSLPAGLLLAWFFPAIPALTAAND